MAKMKLETYLKRYVKSKKARSRIWSASLAEAVKVVKEHFVVVAEDNVVVSGLVINVPKGKSGILVLGAHSAIIGCTITGPHARKRKNKSKTGVTVSG